MKTYKYLWEELISDENIREAVYNASHGAVRGKRQAMLREINYNIESEIPKIREMIENQIRISSFRNILTHMLILKS